MSAGCRIRSHCSRMILHGGLRGKIITKKDGYTGDSHVSVLLAVILIQSSASIIAVKPLTSVSTPIVGYWLSSPLRTAICSGR